MDLDARVEEIFDQTEIEYWFPDTGHTCVSCATLPSGLKLIHFRVIDEKVQFDEMLAQRSVNNLTKKSIKDRLKEGILE